MSPTPEQLDADEVAIADEIEAVAIVGMAGRFPKAADVEEFWENLTEGRECLTEFSEDDIVAAGIPRRSLSGDRVRSRGVLERAEWFEPSFFGYSPREAEIMDPQQRVFLEIAWEALEDAGYDSTRPPGPIGVFAGSGINTYFDAHVRTRPDVIEAFGMFPAVVLNEKDFISTRVAYALDLHGPAITIQTACSTSLVAVCRAAQSLLNYECDLALAGAAAAVFPQCHSSIHEEGGMISPDGHCRPFDADAGGTLFSDGAGAVVLRRLSDAIADGDNIRAVIRGFAVNNDGAAKAGFTAPSVDGQAGVIQLAQEFAGVSPDSISYVEAHGTATPLGDPIEVAALTQAFRIGSDRTGYCGIGSVKSNLGHLDVAAGIAGLIKTTLALEHGLIPPTLHARQPNPRIDWESSPFYVVDHLQEWPRGERPRRAGVSSFGIGGTNAHVVLEEAPQRTNPPTEDGQLLVLSARSEAALDQATTNLLETLVHRSDLELADVAFTLQTGRREFLHRRAIACSDTVDAIATIESASRRRIHTAAVDRLRRPVVFLFSGQGSQYPDMGRGLYETEPTFRACVDRCAEALQPLLSLDLRDLLFPQPEARAEAGEQLRQTAFTQPALFTIEYALARLWQSWGVQPTAMVGHSVGEYVAACIAGVFSLDDALALVAARGRLMQSCDPGSMLAVPLSEVDVSSHLIEGTCVSVINAAGMCVVSGEHHRIEELERRLAQAGVQARHVPTSHAFHSPMMDPILEAFREAVRTASPRAPQLPFVSNVTGTWITPEQATNPDYWAQHLREPVRFADCLTTVLEDPEKALIEVGPGRTLASFARMHPSKVASTAIVSSTRHPDEETTDRLFLLDSVGALWAAGVALDWAAMHADRHRMRVPLPSYPFERQPYLLEPGVARLDHTPPPTAATGATTPGISLMAPPAADGAEDHVERTIAGIWNDLLGVSDAQADDNFFDLGGTSLTAVRMFVLIEERCGCHLPISTLLASPTLGQLAEAVRSEGASPSTSGWQPLVALRTSGTRTPIFLVHAEEGNVLFYRQLVDRLGPDQPVYGLQARGLDGLGADPGEIVDMAADYVDQIRVVAPVGPYHLGGFCLGGTIALEMARQLRDAGETVGPVVMIQTQHRDYLEAITATARRRYIDRPIDRANYELSQLRDLDTRERLRYVGSKARGLGEIVRLSVGGAAKDPGDSPVESTLEIRALSAMHRGAFERHEAEPFDGAVVVIRAQAQPRALAEDPLLGWAPTLKGEVSVVTVPDSHHRRIMYHPAVQRVAEAVENAFAPASTPA